MVIQPSRQTVRVLRWLSFAGLVILALWATREQWFQNLDYLIYDRFVRLASIPLRDDIVIIGVDSQSLAELGRWPFPRDWHARLLQRVAQDQPRVLGVDIHFAEPDRDHPEQDAALAHAIGEAGRVVLPVVLESYADRGLQESLPMPSLQSVAAALGHVDTELDVDGLARSVFLMAGMDRPRWPAFALAVARVAGEWPAEHGLPATGETPAYTEMGAHVWRRHGKALVPFPSREQRLPVLSYVKVLDGRIPPGFFHQKFVLLGATATGLGDNIPTPISALERPVSGVEYNGYVLNALLQDRLIVPVSRQWQYGLLLLGLLLLGMVILRHGHKAVFVLPLLLALCLAADYALLSLSGFWHPPATLMLSILLAGIVVSMLAVRSLLRRQFNERRASSALLDAVDNAVLHLDAQGRIVTANRVAEQLVGRVQQQLQGLPLNQFFSVNNEDLGLFERVLAYRQDELQICNPDGRQYCLRYKLSALATAADERGRWCLVLTDISRERELGEAVRLSRSHDPLTGLPNLEFMKHHIQQRIERASGQPLAVVLLDLDRFCKVNELLGVDIGNQLLKLMGQRLEHRISKQMKIGHLAADEFILVLHEFEDEQALQKRLRTIESVFQTPFQVEDREFSVTATMGVAIFPTHAREPDRLLKQARLACHRGKDLGGRKTLIYQSDMEDMHHRRLRIEQYLRQALNNGAVEIFYQPLVNARSLKIAAVEPLARLKDTEGNWLQPAEFIHVAEHAGLIGDMAYRQLEQACKQLQNWARQGYQFRLSFNFSPYHLQDEQLLERIEEIFRATGYPPQDVDFEITENLLLSDDDEVEQILRRLKCMGVGLTIDDFGTGYSNMGYLTKSHFSRLKIDKTFIDQIVEHSDARSVTASIISLAHELGMTVVAEGVETLKQYELLCRQGCDEIQGYLLARPMPAEDMQVFLRDHQGYAPLPGSQAFEKT